MAYDKAQVEDYIRLFQRKEKGSDIRILLASAELKDSDDIKRFSETALRNNGIYLLIPPITCGELNDDVDKRMAKTRLVRK
jgi:hypothetical protein